MAFTDEKSTSGFLFPSAFLLKAGIQPEHFFGNIFMLKKHDKVIAAIDRGSVDCGAVASTVFETEKEKYDHRFRVIAQTAKIPFPPYAARPGLPEAFLKKLQATIVALSPTSPVIQKMKHNGFYGDAFVIKNDRLYDGIREVNQYVKNK